MKILVLKFRNIGDVLLVNPLLDNLKQYYPKSVIDIAVNKGTESMVDANPNVNQVITYDREFIKSLLLIGRALAELRFFLSFRKAKYDMVINLTEGDRGAQIALFSGAPIRIGCISKGSISARAFTHDLPKQGLRHTLETNLDPLRVLDLPVFHKHINAYCDLGDQQAVESISYIPQHFIHIHPVSRWLFKCISDQTMAEIIDYCEHELQLKVVITAAPVVVELDKVDGILEFCKSKPINLSGKLSLRQTMALNKKAQLFIGVDTAIMHISAANDTPVLAFFGPSGTDQWGPWDNSLMQSTYTKRNGIQAMGQHRVIAQSRDCQPCGQDGCNGTKVSDCLMSLDIDIIKQNIQEMLFEQNN